MVLRPVYFVLGLVTLSELVPDRSSYILGGYKKAWLQFPAAAYSSHLGLRGADNLTSALRQSGVTGGSGSKSICKKENVLF